MRYIFLYLYMNFLTHMHTTFILRTKKTKTKTKTKKTKTKKKGKTTWKDKLFKLVLEAKERRETLLLGLWPRYSFYHYPGH